MIEKYKHIGAIGICVAIIVVIVAVAALISRAVSGGGPERSSENIALQASAGSDTNTGTPKVHSVSQNPPDPSFPVSQTAVTGDGLNRFLTEQDSILMSMMEDMIIRQKTGSASIDFLEAMIPHHRSAIKISQSYLNYSHETSPYRTAARDIITSQENELAQMNDLARKYREQGKKNQEQEDAYLEKYSGMFSRDSLSHHINPAGAKNLDQAFAESMIMHHEMAVEMAKDILDYTDDEEVRQLARNMIDVQEREMEMLQK